MGSVTYISFRRLATLLSVAALVVTGWTAPSLAEAEPSMPDGLTPATAAASCWEIKQRTPQAPSGSYWLLTPALEAPAQFYCDQTYDGGGWVLVGKGREGWQEFYNGHGQPADLAARPAAVTPSYFPTVQLPSRTVDGLLNNAPVGDLPTGVRILRARDATGSTWQNVTVDLRDRDRWVWSLSAVHALDRYRFDAQAWRTGGTVNNFGTDTGYNRVTQGFTSAQGWTTGFAYGGSVTGTSSATSFLWSSTSGTGSARPYAEVYVRPQLSSTTVGWSSIPDSGTAASTSRAHASSWAAPGSWGVTGHLNGRTSEGNAEVQDFAQLGSTVFVAGNFTSVMRYTSPQQTVSHGALAAFDATTGEYRSGFRPVFNNQVKAIALLPDGSLLAAGDFTQANGQPALGTVLLDPVTGATRTRWNLQAENRLTSGVMSVRSIAVRGDHVYLGGSFTHLSGGGVSNVYARHAARVTWADARPDRNWNPEFDGTLMDVDASADGARMYAAGYFTYSKTEPANKVAAVQTVAGAPLATPAWSPTWSNSTRSGYQQAIQSVDNLVYSGGSEHSLFGFSTSTFQRVNGSITYGTGGDFQTLATDGSVIYGGCHCSSWSFQNAFTWSAVTPGWKQADRIQWIGAWDVATGDYIPDFDPQYLRSNNAGAWSSFIAADGTLWAGGDFTGSRTSPGRAQQSGGFVRFPMNDHTAPGAPSSLRVTGTGAADVTLSWAASADGSATYEVLRDDRVVAVTTGTSATVPQAGGNRFYVRAVDPSGNRSASTGVLTLAEAPAPPTQLVTAGSTWSYRYVSEAPAASWTNPAFDDTTWSTGPAPLGWGTSGISTVLGSGMTTSERPLTAYFRHSFDVSDPASIQTLTVSAVADDGAAVYVNGTEVGRLRLNAGTLTHTTYANAAVSTSTASANPLVVDVPPGLLTSGRNTIAVETHLNYRSTPNISMDATVTATGGAG